MQVEHDLLAVAGDVSHTFGLRALEAIHLAAALSSATPELVVATWDEQLSRAAHAAGLAVAP